MKDNRIRYSDKWIVYKHTSPSGKCYIGITSAINPSLRWGRNGSRYLYTYKTTGSHRKFVYAIKKYGWDNFSHEILETDLTEEQAKEFEKYYIDKFDSFYHGYNGTMGGEGTKGLSGNKCVWYGRHHSNETKKKMREIRLGIQMSDEAIQNLCDAIGVRKIIQLTLQGKPIHIYRSANQAKTETKTYEILECCYHNRRTANGFAWMFLDEYESLGFDNRFIEKHVYNKMEVSQYDLKGNLIKIYKSITMAANNTNSDAPSIIDCCKRRRKSHNGYQWRYSDDCDDIGKYNEENYKRYILKWKQIVEQYDLNANKLNEFDSVRDASERTNVDISTIYDCCRHDSNMAGGYIWKYKDDDYVIKPYKNPCHKEVYKMNKDTFKIIDKYSSITNASLDTGISRSCISACCRGMQQTAGGFIWRYKNQQQDIAI